jgi:tetratricopeptide (TPR) repeat protein
LQEINPIVIAKMFGRLRQARNLARTFRDALSSHRQGRLPEAEQLYRAVLLLAPDHVQSLYNLGLIQLRRGELDEALRLLRDALDQKPNFAEAQNAAGMALRASNRHREAIVHCQMALKIKPDFAEAHYNCGAALQALDRHQEAIGHYSEALAIKPDYAEAHSNLGAALAALDRHEEAVTQFHKALAINPNFAEAHSNFGSALQRLRRHDEALLHFERALAIKSDFAEAHHGRGTVLRTLGRLSEARQALERAVALAPRKAEFYGSLAESKRFVDGDPHLALIEGLARDLASLPAGEQLHLHFALGKVYGDLGQHERSFSHLVQGNALKRKQIVYDEAGAMAQLERTRALFTAEAIGRGQGLGDPCPAPVFIIGMPRSGTTLVEQILASHPKVHGAGELYDFEAAVAGLNDPGSTRSGLGGQELRRISGRYLGHLRSLAPAAERITDKMPANFRFAGLIHLALPNARIIHIRRDPVDTCLSCFSILFARGQAFTYELGELGRHYRAYATLMEHWRGVLPSGVMLEVQYEEVVADFEREARRIVAHCGLEWDDACLEFHNTRRPVWTASAIQVRQPIYRSSIGRWRPYESMLQPLLQALEGV